MKKIDEKTVRPRTGPKTAPRQRRPGTLSVRARTMKQARRIGQSRMAEITRRSFQPGAEVMLDHAPSGRPSGMVFMRSGSGHGGTIANPANDAARWIRRRLAAALHPRPNVLVRDGQGVPIAMIDGETRKRRSLTSEEVAALTHGSSPAPVVG